VKLVHIDGGQPAGRHWSGFDVRDPVNDALNATGPLISCHPVDAV